MVSAGMFSGCDWVTVMVTCLAVAGVGVASTEPARSRKPKGVALVTLETTVVYPESLVAVVVAG
jgi:hypothetical protein